MKKIIYTAMIAIACLLTANMAIAGPGHDHSHDHGEPQQSISEAKAVEEAKKSVSNLVEKGKLDSSWTEAGDVRAEKKKFKRATEWVVTFHSDKVADKSKQKLYVFISMTGEYIAANFTGK